MNVFGLKAMVKGTRDKSSLKNVNILIGRQKYYKNIRSKFSLAKL
jgi:hypothetical protein